MSEVTLTSNPNPPFHGGRLHHAAQQFDIPIDSWIDLSTGINPHSYPLPLVPQDVWQKLPDADDNLLSLAAGYYGSTHLLAVVGSQAAIEALPKLRPHSRVGILSPAYAEYAYQWKRQGHDVQELSIDELDAKIARLDVVVVIRPNNPTTELLSQTHLKRWLDLLQKKSGWLVLDEAFIDAMPNSAELSMITPAPLHGLIVLRSVGKFFGLAGIRLGFVWAESTLLSALAAQLTTWSVSSVARWAGAVALQDDNWHSLMRQRLAKDSQQLCTLLAKYDFEFVSTPLFCTVQLSTVQRQAAFCAYQYFAEHGILIRNFEHLQAFRLGLPKNDMAWRQLEKALSELKT
ncbi:threonine-phosphate decarboxylase CobD [Neptunomonas japonica]|uniref:threonine-phosphate decarboxylase CobD n=1 Tax=Neptunomonas japonica TaxID=417574 RepID=UPI00041D1489|nr:threonine-phosphate decarboxylase CobD [Neptunomonas japonica]